LLDHVDGERRPLVAGIAEAVQHDDRGPLAPGAHVYDSALGFDLARMYFSGKWRDGGKRRNSGDETAACQQQCTHVIFSMSSGDDDGIGPVSPE
jgi:hypothetical protein